MKASRKIVLALCVGFLGYAAFLVIEDHNAKSVASAIESSLAVGDPEEKIERVFRARGLEPRYSANERFYSARIVLHQRRDVLIVVRVDAAKKVTAVEVKSRMWL
jgi:hypothetical protein